MTELEHTVFSPYQELLAYEFLWAQRSATIKTMAEGLFVRAKRPSELANEKNPDIFGQFDQQKKQIKQYIDTKIATPPSFSFIVPENPRFPARLLDAQYPIYLFYYRGNLDLLDSYCISVVGTRNLSEQGYKRTEKLVRLLADYKVTLVSGLAEGVDTAALEAAIRYGLPVIGVIGTPIDGYYPKQNRNLQETIAVNHLLISHVPFFRYHTQPFHTKSRYFSERDVTMAALSLATIIVEASDTSGVLFQARACIEQNRLLCILNACFENPALTWPQKYKHKGAIRVKTIHDIIANLDKSIINPAYLSP